MTVDRRRALLAIGGGGLAFVAAGGLYSVTRMPSRALRPWRDLADTPTGDVRLDSLRYAILAPSPHNRQPWQIRLSGTDLATLTCDLDRRLPETDPYDRQTVIGFGCFIELAKIAAAEFGFRLDVAEFPEGEPEQRLDARPIAVLRFVSAPTAVKDDLFRYIPERRSNKSPFDLSRPVAHDVQVALTREASPGVQIVTSSETGLTAALRALTWEAFAIEASTRRTWLESVGLTRIGKSEIDAQPDGISVGGPLLDLLALGGILSRERMADPSSFAFSSGLDLIKTTMGASAAYGWVVTSGNTRRDQLSAGRAYLRMNLAATRAGLGCHPNSQALQEYPEMAATLRRLHDLLGATGDQRVQMLVRLGYAAPVPPTPRWPLANHLMST